MSMNLTNMIGTIVVMSLFVILPGLCGQAWAVESNDSNGASGQQMVSGETSDVPVLPLTFTLAADDSTEAAVCGNRCETCQLPHLFSNRTPAGSVADAASSKHRFWVVSTRGLNWDARCVDLNSPPMRVSRLSCNGVSHRSSMDEYLQSIRPDRRVVFYVHGNRTSATGAVQGGLRFFNRIRPYLDNQPTDWVIFSWPSAQAGYLLKDAREKAFRTDAEGLYLAWLLRHYAQQSIPVAMVGYSFGARVVSGSLHALGGGVLSHRRLGGPYIVGANVSAGLVAAAFDSDWMTPNGYHCYTTKNLRALTVLYNHRDVALRNHWRLSRERSSEALGFSGPRRFGTRVDGTRLPVQALNCTSSVRARHAERFYYDRACQAGSQIACLINQSESPTNLQIKDSTCER